jgi:glutamate racemase
MENRQKPIGIFDSGLGGLTVVKAVRDILPNENIIYLGDTARVPYGNKSKETVERYSLEISHFLVARGAKLIIIACNSSSSLGIDAVRKSIKIPVLGVIGPGARTAARATKNKRIGVIGTRGTIASQSYQHTLEKEKNGYQVFPIATPLFVPLVEEGWSDSDITRQVAQVYLDPMKKEHIDTLILGCTHYPFLKTTIREVLGPEITLVDSAEALATEVKSTLTKLDMANTNKEIGTVEYYTTDTPDGFIETGSRLIDLDLKDTKQTTF